MAQRRRVNVKFVVILISAMCGLAVGAFVLHHFMAKQDPQKYKVLGQRAYDERNYPEAIRQWGNASALEPKNVDLLVKLGDALHELGRVDPAMAGKDAVSWNRALQIDPTFMPALQKLLGVQINVLQYDPQHRSYGLTAMGEIARKILVVNPQDTCADAYLHIASLAGWLAGIETPGDVVELDIKRLGELQEKDASNPDVPFFIAQAYIRQGQEYLRVSALDKAADKFDQAAEVFENALRVRGDIAVLYLRYYQILLAANEISPETFREKAKYIFKMRQVLEKARQCVAKDDPAYSEIYIVSAQFCARHDKRDEAETLMRELLKQRPKDQYARLAMAELLDMDPDKRDEAIRILQEPVEEWGPAGADVLRSRGKLEWDTYYNLAVYMIERYAATPDAAKREGMMAEIREAHERLEDKIRTYRGSEAEKAGMTVKSMTMLGKIELLGNDEQAAIKAIPVLEKANELLHSNNPQAKSYELMYLLSRAYFASRQTGRAKELLYLITDGVPNFVPARLLLTQLLLNDNESEAALIQIGVLDQIAPNEPDVWRLKLACYGMLNPANYGPLIDAELKRIPEKTHADLISKAKACMVLGSRQEKAQELLERAREQSPGDFAVIQLLVQLHLARRDKDPREKDVAIDIAQKACDADPSSDTLRVMLMELKGAPIEEINKVQEDAIGKMPNVLERELRFFKFYQDQGKNDKALEHLDAAEKIKSDDARILDLRFQIDVMNRQWELAHGCVARLAELNADQAGGLIYRFRLAMAEGVADRSDFEVALKIAREMVRDLPEFSRSWLSLGQVQQARGEFDPALRNYTVALQKQSENVDAIRGIVECYYAMGKPEDAYRYIKEGLHSQPGSGYFQEQEVLYQLNYGDPAKAVPYRVAQRNANMDYLDAWLNLIAAHYQVAQVALKPPTPNPQASGDALRQARDVCTEALKKWPDERILYAWMADLAAFSNSVADGEKALLELSQRPTQKDKPESLLMLANYYQRFGKIAEAEDAFKSALLRAGDKGEIVSRLAAFYASQRRFDDAIKLLNSSQETRLLQGQLVEILVQAGRLPEAEAALNKMIVANPKDSGLQAVLGFVYMNTNRTDRALEALNRALDADPRNAKALFWRGYLRLVKQQPPDYDEAIKDLGAAKTLDKRDANACMMLADALRQKNRWDDAIREIEGAMRLMPGNKDIRMKLVELYGNVQPPRWSDAERSLNEALADAVGKSDPDWLRVKAKMWMLRADAEKAVATITEAKAMAPENAQVMQDYMVILLQAKKYAALRDQCSAMLQDPRRAQQEWWIYQLRAVANRNLDLKDEAMADYDKAMRVATALANDDAVATVIQSISDTIGVDDAIRRVVDKAEKGDNHWKVILAYLYLTKGDLPRAVATIDGVLASLASMGKNEADAAQSLAGSIYMSAAQYEKARKVYADLLERNPGDIIANNNMSLIIGEFGTPPNPDKAMNYAQKAFDAMVQRGSVDPNVLDTFGWLKYLSGHPEEGATQIDEALKRRESAESRYHLGKAMLKFSPPQPAQAQAQFKKAQDMLQLQRSKNQKVDAGLSKRVDEALLSVDQMLGSH